MQKFKEQEDDEVAANNFYCAMRMHSAYMPWQDVRPSVCLSVCPTHAGIVPKRYTYPQFFHLRVAPPF